MIESSFLREIQPILEAEAEARGEARLLARQLRELLVDRPEVEPLIARLLAAPTEVVERAASLAVRRDTADELVKALDALLPPAGAPQA